MLSGGLLPAAPGRNTFLQRFSFQGRALHGIILIRTSTRGGRGSNQKPVLAGLKGSVQMNRIWPFLLIAVVMLAVNWLRKGSSGRHESLLLVFNIILSLISAAVLVIVGGGILVVYRGSVVLFGKILYTVLAGAIAAGIVWGDVYAWKVWARKYHVRSMRRKTASRLHVVQGGKSAEADPAEEDEPSDPGSL